jgi:hypothetical protein
MVTVRRGRGDVAAGRLSRGPGRRRQGCQDGDGGTRHGQTSHPLRAQADGAAQRSRPHSTIVGRGSRRSKLRHRRERRIPINGTLFAGSPAPDRLRPANHATKHSLDHVEGQQIWPRGGPKSASGGALGRGGEVFLPVPASTPVTLLNWGCFASPRLQLAEALPRSSLDRRNGLRLPRDRERQACARQRLARNEEQERRLRLRHFRQLRMCTAGTSPLPSLIRSSPEVARERPSPGGGQPGGTPARDRETGVLRGSQAGPAGRVRGFWGTRDRSALPRAWGLEPRNLEPVPRRATCTQVYGGPGTARVVGEPRGVRVSARFDLSDACEIARWRRNATLLGRRV